MKGGCDTGEPMHSVVHERWRSRLVLKGDILEDSGRIGADRESYMGTINIGHLAAAGLRMHDTGLWGFWQRHANCINVSIYLLPGAGEVDGKEPPWEGADLHDVVYPRIQGHLPASREWRKQPKEDADCFSNLQPWHRYDDVGIGPSWASWYGRTHHCSLVFAQSPTKGTSAQSSQRDDALMKVLSCFEIRGREDGGFPWLSFVRSPCSLPSGCCRYIGRPHVCEYHAFALYRICPLFNIITLYEIGEDTVPLTRHELASRDSKSKHRWTLLI